MRCEDALGGEVGFLGDPVQDAPVGVVAASAVGQALRGDARSLQAVDDFIEPDLAWRATQDVPAPWPTHGPNQAGAPQRHQDLVQEGAGDSLAPGDLRALQRVPAMMGGQFEDGAHPVLRLHGQAHGSLSRPKS